MMINQRSGPEGPQEASEGLWRRRRELGYGVSTAFFSNFGQTFFISLFILWIAAQYGVSEGRFGLIYAAATLGAALILPWCGRWIDQVGTASATVVAGLLLAAGMGLLAAGWTWWTLWIALFLLRLLGQGGMSLLSVSTMARCFRRRRGTAMGLASLGFPLGEIILPAVTLAAVAAVGTQTVLWAYAAFLMAAALVLRFTFLLSPLSQEPDIDAGGIGPATSGGNRSWRRDPLFWLITLTAVIMPLAGTVLMLYLMPLATLRGWEPGWVAAGFVVFGVTRAFSSLAAGWLVDRVGAARMFPWMLSMMIGALGTLLVAGNHWMGLGFFVFVGIGFGGATVLSALLADLYGASKIAEIRATSGAFAVFGTAMAPALAGWALLRGWSFEAIFFALLLAAVVSFLAALPVPWWVNRRARVLRANG